VHQGSPGQCVVFHAAAPPSGHVAVFAQDGDHPSPDEDDVNGDLEDDDDFLDDGDVCMDCLHELEDDEDECVSGWETADEADGAGDGAAQPGGARADMDVAHSGLGGNGREVSLTASCWGLCSVACAQSITACMAASAGILLLLHDKCSLAIRLCGVVPVW